MGSGVEVLLQECEISATMRMGRRYTSIITRMRDFSNTSRRMQEVMVYSSVTLLIQYI